MSYIILNTFEKVKLFLAEILATLNTLSMRRLLWNSRKSDTLYSYAISVPTFWKRNSIRIELTELNGASED